MSQAELAQFEQSFERVIIDLSDGNQLLMFKCIKCEYICRSNLNTRLAHWKRCASKFAFKYANQHESTGGIIVECIKCHLRLLSPTLYDMKTHFERCPMKWLPNPAQTTQNGPFASTYFSAHSNNQLHSYSKSNAVACFYETMVSKKEMDAQRKASTVKNSVSIWVSRNGFKRKYVQSSKGPELHYECQTCNLLVRKPTTQSLHGHRSSCIYPSNVQMNASLQQISPQTHAMVQPFMLPQTTYNAQTNLIAPTHTMTTQTHQSHTPISSPWDDNYGQQDSSLYMQQPGVHWLLGASPKLCFVCNTSSSPTFVDLFGTVTKHTNTKILDYIEKFQKNISFGRNVSFDDATTNWNYVCADCLETINAFDLTCMTAAKLEFKLREKLSCTEELYAKRRNGIDPQNVDNGNATMPSNGHFVPGEIIDLDSPPPIQEQATILQLDAEKDNDEAECEKVHYLVELSDGEESQTVDLNNDQEQ